MTLHPQDTGVTSKTGEFDGSLLVDNPDFSFMPPMLAMLKQEALASPSRLVFPPTHVEWSTQYTKAGSFLNLHDFGPPVWNQLCHGWAPVTS